MKTAFCALALGLIFSSSLFSQTSSWHVLPNAPNTSDRFEDTYFLNPNTGWVIYYPGRIYRTTDGGHNWDTLFHSISNLAFRSTGFFDANVGIIGTLDQAHFLYRTTDGGTTWNLVTSITGTLPQGICGISIVDSNVAYACGRYYCPGNVIKTTNKGVSWVSLNIDTTLARSFVDCKFWTADSGIVVGGYSPTNQFISGKSVVLFTSNGGTNWTRRYISTRDSEWCWKIDFISRQVGYVSIESETIGNIYYLKTTNGGISWQDQLFIANYDVEGIGFVNENTGWIGGNGDPNNPGPNYETTNGGASWHLAGWGISMNRVRFLSDTLAYAVGKTVYKYTSEPIGIQPISTEVPKQYSLEQNYPNPFNPNSKIKFQISKFAITKLIIYDVLGKEVSTLINEQLNPGTYEVNWDASNFPSGVYFYRLQTETFTESKKMLLIK